MPNTANIRHLTFEENQTIASIIDQVGVVEVLRLVGMQVRNRHPQIDERGDYCHKIFLIAKDINTNPKPPPGSVRSHLS